jgi:hypothetical protein
MEPRLGRRADYRFLGPQGQRGAARGTRHVAGKRRQGGDTQGADTQPEKADAAGDLRRRREVEYGSSEHPVCVIGLAEGMR